MCIYSIGIDTGALVPANANNISISWSGGPYITYPSGQALMNALSSNSIMITDLTSGKQLPYGGDLLAYMRGPQDAPRLCPLDPRYMNNMDVVTVWNFINSGQANPYSQVPLPALSVPVVSVPVVVAPQPVVGIGGGVVEVGQGVLPTQGVTVFVAPPPPGESVTSGSWDVHHVWVRHPHLEHHHDDHPGFGHIPGRPDKHDFGRRDIRHNSNPLIERTAAPLNTGMGMPNTGMPNYPYWGSQPDDLYPAQFQTGQQSILVLPSYSTPISIDNPHNYRYVVISATQDSDLTPASVAAYINSIADQVKDLNRLVVPEELYNIAMQYPKVATEFPYVPIVAFRRFSAGYIQDALNSRSMRRMERKFRWSNLLPRFIQPTSLSFTDDGDEGGMVEEGDENHLDLDLHYGDDGSEEGDAY